ncbi:uncharacterized protein LOC110836950 isoform X2 [Zootermopsis nevadensis]|uniref:uncharacterized protein LOC110836950 isoform X2 n=1 Tax=Zootermopsis nevadensis TaxID=136037 RepID=UPI000B8EC24F|nr:uncharacterized protein LOC110836950 isoform X2 [Zootermopsis nevadensis]
MKYLAGVKVAPDFNKVNVFWLARGTENDVEVESILKRSAGHLRHQLSELRVMGVVPYIEFVKDTQYAKVVEVERILATADFGEDYVPVGAGCQLKSEFTMHTHLPPNIKSHIEKVEDEIPEPSLPPMRMDVLGLRHEEIMNKIRNSVKKSHALHRHDVRIPLQNFTNSESVQQNLEDANHDIFNLKKEDFTKFLKKRHFLHKKALCSKKNYRPELELHENEVLEGGTVVSDFLDSVREEKDYVDDSEDVKL